MKAILTFVLCLCALPSLGQIAKVEKSYLVELPSAAQAFHPVFSSDGEKLLLTSTNHVGLSVYDLKRESMEVITDAQGAGFQATFDEAGEQVLYRAVSRKKGRLYKTLMNYDLNEQSQTALSGELRSQSELADLRKANLRRAMPGVRVSTANLKIIVHKEGKQKELTPLQDVPGYIWVSLSPDASKILFTAVSRGTFVCDLDGNILSSLGFINAPVWYGNDLVVGMEDKDDGEQVTSSKIVVATADGKVSQTLTPADRIAMYPAVSLATGRIAYNTDKGELYIMEVSTLKNR